MATSNAEQLIVELINRARLDPLAEAERLNIGLNRDLAPGTIKGQPLEPLAWDDSLALAAERHSKWMLQANTFSHTGKDGSTLVERSDDAGYSRTGLWALRENLSRIGVRPDPIDMNKAAPAHHANLYASESHRVNIFADDIREIGLGQVKGVYTTNADYNTSMLTQKFGRTGSDYFVTGVVINDADRDDFYDIGEGLSGYTFSAGGRSDSTKGSGGYEVAVAPANSLQVTIAKSGSTLAKVKLDMSDGNAKLDLIRGGGDELALSTSATLVSGVSAARLLGAAHLDLTGNGAGNKLTGNRGKNKLEGAGGNDVIDGGAGTDTAVLRIDRDDATVSTSNGIVTISSSLGTDTYKNIEFFQFADGRVAAADLGASSNGGGSTGGGSGGSSGGSTGGSGGSGGGTGGRRFEGGNGDDRLVGTDGSDGMLGRGGNDTIFGHGGNDNIAAHGGDDIVYGGAGNDKIGGSDGNDRLYGGTGRDIIGSGNGNDLIRTEGGHDIASGGYGRDEVYGGNGDDVLAGSYGNDKVSGDGGNDQLGGGQGNDVIFGGSGRDTIGAGEDNDIAYGGDDNDFIGGADGNDMLYGENGNDVLNGGADNDLLVGGAGRDEFVFSKLTSGERDAIADYTDGVDTIRLHGVAGGGANARFQNLSITAAGNDTEISYGGHVIKLAGVNPSQLDAGDFIFAG